MLNNGFCYTITNMKFNRTINVQKSLDSIIDKVFLRFIPKSVKPNYVTVIRFLLVPVVYWLLKLGRFDLALVVFVIAASTDFIDGTMARTRNQITDLGKVIDPVADKLLIVSVLLFIGISDPIVRIFVIFIVFEMGAVLIGHFFSFAIGKPIGANVFGKIKLILQSFSVGFFILGILISNALLIDASKYILFVALIFAIAAGVETTRRKTKNYLDNHNIAYSKK